MPVGMLHNSKGKGGGGGKKHGGHDAEGGEGGDTEVDESFHVTRMKATGIRNPQKARNCAELRKGLTCGE
ncbi:hypothetical protein GCM10011399_11860 [Subtercola lobariae]|uniref:Uncharacterized protein n=1 Tax=Subtercola lobariae TaxID=1588641 RepID=A0A917EXQ6_9MICO|nr:hypothetical protein GCM10011399_11860 [Subtercola lobariae]